MLRFTLNKCKYIELTTNAGLQRGDWVDGSDGGIIWDARDRHTSTCSHSYNGPAQQMQTKGMSTHHQHLTPTFDMAAPADVHKGKIS